MGPDRYNGATCAAVAPPVGETATRTMGTAAGGLIDGEAGMPIEESDVEAQSVRCNAPGSSALLLYGHPAVNDCSYDRFLFECLLGFLSPESSSSPSGTLELFGFLQFSGSLRGRFAQRRMDALWEGAVERPARIPARSAVLMQ